MKCSAVLSGIRDEGSGAQLFDVGELLRRLEGLGDPRHPKGLRYELAPLLLLIVLAKLSKEDQPSGIASWVTWRQSQLREILGLDWPKMPHHGTYRRVIAEVVEPEQFDQEVGAFLRQLPRVGRSVLISIDGKTVRGTISAEHPRGEHLLAAYLPEEGIVLAQVKAGDHDNEITAAPELLRCLDLRGKVVIGDAIHTQRALSVQILEASGDYLWYADGNQPTLHEEIKQLFDGDQTTVLGGVVENDFVTHRTTSKGHGRREVREITVSSELDGYSDWPGIKQVFKLERWRTNAQTEITSHEIVYGLTSLARKRASAKTLLRLIRDYWGIENGLHGCRDVTFREDRCRLTRGHAGRVMASINNLVISLLRYSGARNIAEARRRCNADLPFALSVLSARPLT
jgi:predicted transposase YbfD/YdcC